MYSKKIQENVQKNILTNLQTKNSLDFSGLFLGPEKKTEKIREKFPGRKNPAKKILAFLQEKEKKKRRNLLKKSTEKKFCKFFCIFWLFLAIF